MATGPITKTSVDALECPPRKDREILWDGGHREAVRGFGVAAFRNGGKCYIAQYRKDGRSRRARIGEHGRLTPEEARRQAKNVLGAVESGKDPIAERKAAREVRTFKAVASDFLDHHVKAKRKARTADEYERILTLHVIPALGSKRIVDLGRADVAKLHSKLSDSPYQANRAVALVSAVWNWAARRDEVPFAENPARAVERFAERSRERYLTSDELARVGDTLREGETVGLPYSIDETKPNAKHAPKTDYRHVKLDPFAVAAIRLLVLTGARLREILDAQWSQLDIERGILFLSDSKTGKKPLYLSAAAQTVLARNSPNQDNPHIIAGALRALPAPICTGLGKRSARRRGSTACASMICATASLRSEPARHSACLSSASCSATHRPPQPIVMPIWTPTQCGAPLRRLARPSRQQWRADARTSQHCHRRRDDIEQN